jgi:Flp pilus assembly protein TadB
LLRLSWFFIRLQFNSSVMQNTDPSARTASGWTRNLRQFTIVACCAAVFFDLVVAWLRYRETGAIAWRPLFRDLVSATLPLGLLWWGLALREPQTSDERDA